MSYGLGPDILMELVTRLLILDQACGLLLVVSLDIVHHSQLLGGAEQQIAVVLHLRLLPLQLNLQVSVVSLVQQRVRNADPSRD